MRAVRIETSPFQILSLVEFESVLKKNQHGCAKVSGYISAEEKDQLMAMISEETWAHIWFYDETEGKNILFCGYIEDLRITLLLINPLKASLTLNTPVITRPTQTIMDVRPSGIFSVTNMIMANARNINVITVGLIENLLFSLFYRVKK